MTIDTTVSFIKRFKKVTSTISKGLPIIPESQNLVYAMSINDLSRDSEVLLRVEQMFRNQLDCEGRRLRQHTQEEKHTANSSILAETYEFLTTSPQGDKLHEPMGDVTAAVNNARVEAIDIVREEDKNRGQRLDVACEEIRAHYREIRLEFMAAEGWRGVQQGREFAEALQVFQAQEAEEIAELEDTYPLEPVCMIYNAKLVYAAATFELEFDQEK